MYEYVRTYNYTNFVFFIFYTYLNSHSFKKKKYFYYIIVYKKTITKYESQYSYMSFIKRKKMIHDIHTHILISLGLSRSLSTFVQRKKLTCIHASIRPLSPTPTYYIYPHTHPSPSHHHTTHHKIYTYNNTHTHILQ